ncbi:Hsp20/alpha crystallin family protein [Fimbriiglobus ruber]|uniref:Heat shock protein, HSP20 family n=1 Tax=Fimbriiglobus ruber TaxID=1908690 RepID=A0A225D4I8_9BACT|nr:Hsp20/alpha crystallin family protein [Fimbriiglobus ruber]OWK35853.1 Heat shock protein, HSP20 family [Fimbriiglobus ruber]
MFTVRRETFGDLLNEFTRVSEDMNRLFGLKASGGVTLPIQVWADENNLYAEVDLPAFDPAKFDISVTEGNQLTIQGERTAPEVNGAVWVRQERPFGKFSRVVTLPFLVDADKVEAKYEHGVLKLTLPKSEAAKPRKITVKA